MSGRYQVGTPIARAGGVVLSRKTVYLTPKLANALARFAFDHGLNQSEVMADALAAHLGLPPAKEPRKGKP